MHAGDAMTYGDIMSKIKGEMSGTAVVVFLLPNINFLICITLTLRLLLSDTVLFYRTACLPCLLLAMAWTA